MINIFKLDRIILCTDFSNAAENALNTAVHIAEQHSCKLTLVHVVDITMIQFASENRIVCAPTGQLVRIASENLDMISNRLSAEHHINVNFAVLTGKPVYEICLYSKRENIDLIVVGKRGEFNSASVLIGEISAAIVGRAETPVLSVPSTKLFTRFKKILFPVQELDSVMDDYKVIRPIGRRSNATVVVAGIAKKSVLNVTPSRLIRLVQLVLKKIEMDGLHTTRRIEASEDFSEEIIAISNEEEPDLIFLTHSQKPETRYSDFSKVLAASQCPVLSVNSALSRIKNHQM